MYTLPTEIFHELFGYLSVHDLCSVRFLNKYLNNEVEGYLRPKLMWESRTETEIRQYKYSYIPTRLGSMWESQTKTDINQLIDIIRTRTESGLTFPTILTSFHFHLRYMSLDQCEEFANIYGEYVERYYFSTVKTDEKCDQDKAQVLLNNSRNTVQLNENETNQTNDEVCPNSTSQQEGIFLEIDASVSVQLFQSMLTTNRAIKSVKLNSNSERGSADIQEMLISVPEVFKLGTAIKIFQFRYDDGYGDKSILDFATSKVTEIESLRMTFKWGRYGIAHLNDFLYHFSNKLSKLRIVLGQKTTFEDNQRHVIIPYLPNLTCLKIFAGCKNVFVKRFVQGQFPKLKKLTLGSYFHGISEQLDVLHNLNLEYLNLNHNYSRRSVRPPLKPDFEKLYAFLESQSRTLKTLKLFMHTGSIYTWIYPSMKALECLGCFHIDSLLLNSFDFPSLRLVRLSPYEFYTLHNKDKVLPNVTGLVFEDWDYFNILPNCYIPLHTDKVFPNLTKLEFFMNLKPHHLEYIFTRMFTLKELSILCQTHREIHGLWQALTGFDKSKEIDGKENIYGKSLEDMHALEYLRIINPSLTFLDALEYLAKTNRMNKLNTLCLEKLPYTYFTDLCPFSLQVQNIIRTLKTYHQQVLEKGDLLNFLEPILN